MATDFIRTTARLTLTAGGEPYLFGFNWDPGTPGGSSADATDCLARFRAFWFAGANIIAAQGVISFDTVVLGYDADTGKVDSVWSATPVTTVTPAGSGDVLPAQTQGLIRWTTNAIDDGVRVKGRTFVPLPIESLNAAGGVPAGGYTSGLTAMIAAIQTSGSTGSTPGIWHRKTDTSVGFIAPLVGGAASATWAVLRGRR